MAGMIERSRGRESPKPRYLTRIEPRVLPRSSRVPLSATV